MQQQNGKPMEPTPAPAHSHLPLGPHHAGMWAAVPTRKQPDGVCPAQEVKQASASQQEISNHFSDTKATGIRCRSEEEGLQRAEKWACMCWCATRASCGGAVHISFIRGRAKPLQQCFDGTHWPGKPGWCKAGEEARLGGWHGDTQPTHSNPMGTSPASPPSGTTATCGMWGCALPVWGCPESIASRLRAASCQHVDEAGEQHLPTPYQPIRVHGHTDTHTTKWFENPNSVPSKTGGSTRKCNGQMSWGHPVLLHSSLCGWGAPGDGLTQLCQLPLCPSLTHLYFVPDKWLICFLQPAPSLITSPIHKPAAL